MSDQINNRNYRRQMYKALPTQSSSAFESMDTIDENGNETDNISGETIHWKFVPHDVRCELIRKLNPAAPVSGNDWRMLAHEMGYTAEDINFFESEKENNTSVLFRYYDIKPGASFNDVYKFLAKMQRHDCVAVLKTAYTKIRQDYIQAQRAPRFPIAGIQNPPLTGGHNQQLNHSCPCTQTGHLTSAYRGHTYCPCGNGYTICECVSNGHFHCHSTHHSMLPHPNQLEISQPAGISVHSPPGHTCSVRTNVTRKPQTHLSHSGYAQEQSSSANAFHFPDGSICNHQLKLHTHNPGFQAGRNNVNVTDDSTVTNTNTRRNTSRQKVDSQHSGDCNAMTDFNTDRCQNNCNSNGTGTDPLRTCVTTGHVGVKTETAKYSGIPNSVNHLNDPARHMDHTDRLLSDSETDFLQGNSDGLAGMFFCDSSTGQSVHGDRLPATFPLMRKAKCDPATVVSEDLRTLQKSVSVPADVKPKVFRKVLQSSTLFVTCSQDNDLHVRAIITLCQFLNNNGFPCHVDSSNRGSSDSSPKFYRQRIAEADFILVCISNKYLEDISAERSDLPSSVRNNQMHTREIYELLKSQHLSSDHGNSSDIARTPHIIPILFDKMMEKHIPGWMRGIQTYKWPEEHMDLIKLLRKPEEKRR